MMCARPLFCPRWPGVLILAIAVLNGMPAWSDPTDPSLAPIQQAARELIRAEMREHKVPGLSLSLVDARRTLWSEGFGFADRERRIPVTADTLFVAGNLTQAMTAALAMQLAEQGRLILDAPLQQQLPEFSIRTRFPNSRPITPRDLLSHHSGLPAMYFCDMWARRPEPYTALVARLRDEFVAFPPREVRVQSFPGYDVAGRLIETRCGDSYVQCMKQRLFLPLGMTHSSFDHGPRTGLPVARHYWSQSAVDFTAVRDLPAAGLLSSANDLGTFAKMLLNRGRHHGRTILKASSVDELFRVQNRHVALDLDHNAGLPWNLSGVHFARARHVAWLDNESPFARGRILLVPDQGLGVVVLTNSSGSSDAVRRVSERLMQLILDTRPPPAPAMSQTAAATRLEFSERETIVGHYATQLGQISVHATTDGYRARLLGKMLDLELQPDGMLAPVYRLLGLIPIPLDVLRETRLTTAHVAGRQLAIARYRGRTYRFGERVQPVTLTAAWRQRLGEYRATRSDELLKLINMRSVTLRHENGVLFFRYRVPGWLGLVADVPVRPVSDTELVVEGTGWLMGETIRAANRGGRDTLRYSGYELRRTGR